MAKIKLTEKQLKQAIRESIDEVFGMSQNSQDFKPQFDELARFFKGMMAEYDNLTQYFKDLADYASSDERSRYISSVNPRKYLALADESRRKYQSLTSNFMNAFVDLYNQIKSLGNQ